MVWLQQTLRVPSKNGAESRIGQEGLLHPQPRPFVAFQHDQPPHLANEESKNPVIYGAAPLCEDASKASVSQTLSDIVDEAPVPRKRSALEGDEDHINWQDQLAREYCCSVYGSTLCQFELSVQISAESRNFSNRDTPKRSNDRLTVRWHSLES
jgi:hypothetical protein